MNLRVGAGFFLPPSLTLLLRPHVWRALPFRFLHQSPSEARSGGLGPRKLSCTYSSGDSGQKPPQGLSPGTNPNLVEVGGTRKHCGKAFWVRGSEEWGAHPTGHCTVAPCWSLCGKARLDKSRLGRSAAETIVLSGEDTASRKAGLSEGHLGWRRLVLRVLGTNVYSCPQINRGTKHLCSCTAFLQSHLEHSQYILEKLIFTKFLNP